MKITIRKYGMTSNTTVLSDEDRSSELTYEFEDVEFIKDVGDILNFVSGMELIFKGDSNE